MRKPPALARAIAALRPQAVQLSVLAFRSILLRHFAKFSTAFPLFAAAGGKLGSRYVLPNGPAALYAAFDADTAHREGNRRFYRTVAEADGPSLLQSGELRPDAVVVIGVHLRAERIIDLRNPATRRRLGIRSVAELLGPWLGVADAPTQLLGDAVFNDGELEGIIYPSAQNPGHDCVVLFPDRLLPASSVDFSDPATGLAAHLP